MAGRRLWAASALLLLLSSNVVAVALRSQLRATPFFPCDADADVVLVIDNSAHVTSTVFQLEKAAASYLYRSLTRTGRFAIVNALADVKWMEPNRDRMTTMHRDPRLGSPLSIDDDTLPDLQEGDLNMETLEQDLNRAFDLVAGLRRAARTLEVKAVRNSKKVIHVFMGSAHAATRRDDQWFIAHARQEVQDAIAEVRSKGIEIVISGFLLERERAYHANLGEKWQTFATDFGSMQSMIEAWRAYNWPQWERGAAGFSDAYHTETGNINARSMGYLYSAFYRAQAHEEMVATLDMLRDSAGESLIYYNFEPPRIEDADLFILYNGLSVYANWMCEDREHGTDPGDPEELQGGDGSGRTLPGGSESGPSDGDGTVDEILGDDGSTRTRDGPEDLDDQRPTDGGISGDDDTQGRVDTTSSDDDGRSGLDGHMDSDGVTDGRIPDTGRTDANGELDGQRPDTGRIDGDGELDGRRPDDGTTDIDGGLDGRRPDDATTDIDGGHRELDGQRPDDGRIDDGDEQGVVEEGGPTIMPELDFVCDTELAVAFAVSGSGTVDSTEVEVARDLIRGLASGMPHAQFTLVDGLRDPSSVSPAFADVTVDEQHPLSYTSLTEALDLRLRQGLQPVGGRPPVAAAGSMLSFDELRRELDRLEPNLPRSSNDVDSALRQAIATLDDSNAPRKVLVLLTEGVHNAFTEASLEFVASMPQGSPAALIRRARSRGIFVVVLAVGAEESSAKAAERARLWGRVGDLGSSVASVEAFERSASALLMEMYGAREVADAVAKQLATATPEQRTQLIALAMGLEQFKEGQSRWLRDSIAPDLRYVGVDSWSSLTDGAVDAMRLMCSFQRSEGDDAGPRDRCACGADFVMVGDVSGSIDEEEMGFIRQSLLEIASRVGGARSRFAAIETYAEPPVVGAYNALISKLKGDAVAGGGRRAPAAHPLVPDYRAEIEAMQRHPQTWTDLVWGLRSAKLTLDASSNALKAVVLLLDGGQNAMEEDLATFLARHTNGLAEAVQALTHAGVHVFVLGIETKLHEATAAREADGWARFSQHPTETHLEMAAMFGVDESVALWQWFEGAEPSAKARAQEVAGSDMVQFRRMQQEQFQWLRDSASERLFFTDAETWDELHEASLNVARTICASMADEEAAAASDAAEHSGLVAQH